MDKSKKMGSTKLKEEIELSNAQCRSGILPFASLYCSAWLFTPVPIRLYTEFRIYRPKVRTLLGACIKIVFDAFGFASSYPSQGFRCSKGRVPLCQIAAQITEKE
jgi:hypothetical protein